MKYLLLLIFLSSCNLSERVTPREFEACENVCKINGGLTKMSADGNNRVSCRCNNGAKFSDIGLSL